jgi:hypothetical protein
VKNGLGEAPDLGGHRRREEQRLSPARHTLDDSTDVADEAHVEHAIRFIEHEDLDRGEIDTALTDEIEQPPGRCHHDVGSGAETPNLVRLAHSAEDGGMPQREVPAVRVEALSNLSGQLAGRTQDQRPGAHVAFAAPLRGAAGRPRQPMEDREREGAGLSCTGLGASDNVSSGERRGKATPRL